MSGESERFLTRLFETLQGRVTQIPTAQQVLFESLHDAGHFFQENLVRDVGDVLRDTNLPNLLVGVPKNPHAALKVEGDCDVVANNRVDVTVTLEGVPVLVLTLAFAPNGDAIVPE